MSNAELSGFLGHWLPRLKEMRAMVAQHEAAVAPHYAMIRYHMGWANEALPCQNFPSGKRIRPTSVYSPVPKWVAIRYRPSPLRRQYRITP